MRRAALVALVSLLLALPASASAAGLKAIWGPTKLNGGAGPSAFPVYEELGVDVFQYQLDWAAIAPTEPSAPTNPADPAYNWPSAVDFAISEAAAHGMDVALLVKGTPWWAVNGAAPGANVRSQGPADVQDYANFLTAASARYPTVHRWMIWGEANRAAVWSSGPVAYANLLDAAYGALKPLPSDPDTVVGGMSFTFGETPPRQWIGALVRSNGQRPRLDEYGHNPFTRRCPDIDWGPDFLVDGSRDIGDIDTLIGEVRGAFGPQAKLWLSEYTIASDRPNRALSFFLSREEQAEWLTKAFRIAGSASYVSGLGWFNLHDEPASILDGLTTGLMTYEGERKPAFAAYQAARLDGSQPLVPCPKPPPPGTPGGGSPPVHPAELVLEARAARSAKLGKALKSGYPVQVRCGGRCSVNAALLLSRSAGKRLGLTGKALRVASAKRALPAAGKATLKLRFSTKAKAKLRRAKQVPLTLVVTAKDGAGGSSTSRQAVRLRR
jgi:hypothetical protein